MRQSYYSLYHLEGFVSLVVRAKKTIHTRVSREKRQRNVSLVDIARLRGDVRLNNDECSYWPMPLWWGDTGIKEGHRRGESLFEFRLLSESVSQLNIQNDWSR